MQDIDIRDDRDVSHQVGGIAQMVERSLSM